MKRTKIVCTLGPSSSSEEVIRELLLNGMNVARFNFSHGSHEEHHERMKTFKKVRDELNIPAAVILDTKGPEIRLGDFENNSVTLKKGDDFVLTSRNIIGNEKIANMTYEKLCCQAYPGCKILIDDGKVELKVVSINDKDVVCKVISGGKISNHKGVNVPSISLDLPALSERDKSDLLFGIEEGIDFIALSFVRNVDDVISARKFLDYNGGEDIKIIAKIENQEGIDNFDEILKVANGIMVARGDMGVEVDYEKLPGIQKRFIFKCCQAGKVVITATQMLDSMITSPTPTRAEVSDVANAVFDGTSAVMLSGETANGKYPVETVKAMNKIAIEAENDAFHLGIYQRLSPNIHLGDVTNAISDATCTTARDVNAAAIIAVTRSGVTARRISKFRPKNPIIATTPCLKTYHQLSLCWGVMPVLAKVQDTTDKLFSHAIACARQIDMVKSGDAVVITAGVPIGVSGNTNILKVEIVK